MSLFSFLSRKRQNTQSDSIGESIEKPSTPETLLTVLGNQSDNIEYTKNRSYFLLAAYSAICFFIMKEKNFADFFELGLPIATIFCVKIILDNNSKIQRRRMVLDRVLLELKQTSQLSISLYKALDSNLKNKGPVDAMIPWASIVYMLAVLTITLLSI